MYTNIILPRRLSRLTCICRSVSTVEGQKLPQTSTSSDGISPPPRITRGSTDILQALAATVGPDPTAAHYKYHDDPFLIPLSNYRKRAYALAAEAGRKAAAWVRDEHAELFTIRVWDPPMKKKTPYFNADPKINAFAPKPIYNDESKVTEDDLRYTIQNALLEDSIKVFQLLGGAENLSEDLKMDFLQLLCFYNEKEPDSGEWLEERWFAAVTRERQAATWRLGGLADKIFTSMEPKTPEAYCAVIQGMAKYYQAQRAEDLLQEATENGIQLSTDVYNALLGCVGFLREGVALRIEELKSFLGKMNQQGLTPNQETLSACLKSLSAWGGGQQLRATALQVVNEFRTLGIQPSLSAYYYLLCLFCKERGPPTDILSSILMDLKKRDTLEAVDPTDTNFFITAMGVCSDHLQDVNMADRVHALLMKGDNYKLVGDAYKESIYYRHYVTVHCRHAPFEKAIQLLDTLVPNVYVPEPTVMDEIINTLELSGSGERLAQAWSQIVIFGHAKRIKLIEKLLSAMCSCYQYQDEEVKTKMRSAASDILKFGRLSEAEVDTKDARTPIAQKLSANALCNIIELCADSKDKSDVVWETIAEALQRLRSQEAVGVPNKPDVLSEAAKKAVAIGMQGIAATALTYLAESGFPEAVTASQEVLAAMLNRPEEEIQLLLQKPKSELEATLHPSALVVAEAYHLAKSGGSVSESGSANSSESDSESSSDDE